MCVYIYNQSLNTWRAQISTCFLKILVGSCLHLVLGLQCATGHLLPSLVPSEWWCEWRPLGDAEVTVRAKLL